jgi:carboxyl-terminal processing protease
MNKKIPLGIAVSIALIAAAISHIVTSRVTLAWFNESLTPAGEKNAVYAKFDEVDAYMRANYYGGYGFEANSDGAYSGFLKAFGGDCEYLTASQYAQNERYLAGTFDGFGFSAIKDSGGYLKVTDIYRGSSAEMAGMSVGDIVTEVDTRDVLISGADSVAEYVSNTDNKKITVTFLQGAEEQKVLLEKSAITPTTVSASVLNECLFIRINDLNAQTGEQFKTVMKRYADTAVKGYIFDFRGLGSLVTDNSMRRVRSVRLLGVFAQIAESVFPPDSVFVSISPDGSNKNITVTNTENPLVKTVVLVDTKTAGLAELLAAGLDQYLDAQIIGTRTSGKGVLYDIHLLSDGTAVRIPVLKVKCGDTDFNASGLAPDFIIENAADFTPPKYAEDADISGDTQLQKAFSLFA